MLYCCHRHRKGDIRWSHGESCHRGHGTRTFSTRHVKHWGHTTRTVRPSFYLFSGDNDPRVYTYSQA
jgi:hypothetical protein